jgi:hypothetical protein
VRCERRNRRGLPRLWGSTTWGNSRLRLIINRASSDAQSHACVQTNRSPVTGQVRDILHAQASEGAPDQFLSHLFDHPVETMRSKNSCGSTEPTAARHDATVHADCGRDWILAEFATHHRWGWDSTKGKFSRKLPRPPNWTQDGVLSTVRGSVAGN